MEIIVTGEKVIRPEKYKMIFFRSAAGKSLVTHIDRERIGNAKWWWNLKRGDRLEEAHLLNPNSNIVNADFIPKKVTERTINE